MSTVLVVGAGPTGLTLACGLAADGIDVRVVDQAPEPAPTSRANILHARGVEVLRRVGALGDLPERSLAPVGMRMHVRDQPLTTMRFRTDDTEDLQALFVSQASIEAELRRRLDELGVRIEWGTSIVGGTQDASGVTVELGDGGTVRTGWLVGCDGARSTVRELAGVGFPGVPIAEQFLLADVRTDWERDRSTSAGWFHRDGIVLAVPMREADGREGDLWRLMADVPPADQRLTEADIIEWFERLIPERTGETGMRVREAVWTSVFRIHRRLADDYRRGRILLSGDAAHIHSPIGGQGMNTGIGDAENLAWKLALVVRDAAPATLLDTYTAERRPLATDVLRNTTRNTELLLGKSPLTRLVRDRVLVPLLNLPSVQRKATRTASQLWVSYRKGPLGGPGRGGLRPGDRVPDRDCRRLDGTPTRLFDELGPSWVVLGRQADELSPLVDGVREHLGARVVALLDGSSASVAARLVRPDGHLAWRGTSAADLRSWLSRHLGSPTVDSHVG